MHNTLRLDVIRHLVKQPYFQLWVTLFLFLIVAVYMAWRPLRRKAPPPLKTSLFLVMLFLLPVVAYLRWGGWFEWRHYQVELAKQAQAQALFQAVQGNPDIIIQRLKKRLFQDPKSAQGWYLLGRLYAGQNKWKLARGAFENAYQLQPKNERVVINYAQSLWQLNHQHCNNEIRTLLQILLKENANQPDALAMLAMDAYMGHAYQLAIEYWQHLLAIIPSQSEDAITIRKAIAKAQLQLTNAENKGIRTKN